MNPVSYACVAAGSALGGVLRAGLGELAVRMGAAAWPMTMIINVAGSFLIGYWAFRYGAVRQPEAEALRYFLCAGLCGGFTTFSGFSLQTLALAQEGHMRSAVANVTLSVALCLAATWLGRRLAG